MTTSATGAPATPRGVRAEHPTPAMGRSGRSTASPPGGLHGFGLTRREIAVLAVMGEGHSTRATARRLHISPRTVSKHQEHIYRKLGVSDRLSAVLMAQRLGLPGHVDDREAV